MQNGKLSCKQLFCRWDCRLSAQFHTYMGLHIDQERKTDRQTNRQRARDRRTAGRTNKQINRQTRTLKGLNGGHTPRTRKFESPNVLHCLGGPKVLRCPTRLRNQRLNQTSWNTRGKLSRNGPKTMRFMFFPAKTPSDVDKFNIRTE